MVEFSGVGSKSLGGVVSGFGGKPCRLFVAVRHWL